MTTSVHCTRRWPARFTTTGLWFSEWVVRLWLLLCPNLLLFHPSSLSPSVCLRLWLSPALIQYLSFDFRLMILVWSFASAGPMTQSTALHAENVGGGAHWGSFRTVSLATWANKERARGGRETSRKAIHQLVKEHWRSDSRCTITLVFRFGPSA